MNIKIIAVGKIKEKYINLGLDEFKKRLKTHCNLEIIEVPDEPTKENASEKEENIIKLEEEKRILKHIKDTDYVITLEIKANSLSSEALASFIEDKMLEGISNITFVIGGSLGLGEGISSRANYKLSFSKLTFPHQLMRLILLEQIYRSFRIINNFPYHK